MSIMRRWISRERLRGYALVAASWALLALVLLRGDLVERIVTPLVYFAPQRHPIGAVAVVMLSNALLFAAIWRWETRSPDASRRVAR
jgi:hypothetical protein